MSLVASGASRGGIRGDLALAFSAWRRAPLLPLFTVLLNAAVIALTDVARRSVGSALGFIALPDIALILFLVGYSGTERWWYRSAWEGGTFGLSDVWTVTWRWCVPFVGLGLLAAFLLLPFAAMDSAFRPRTFPVFSPVALIVVDMLGTFISPALAFQTSSDAKAIPAGLAMLRKTWPNSAIYVLFPPFALVMLVRLGAIDDLTLSLTLAVVVSVLGSLAKGATAACYLRNLD